MTRTTKIAARVAWITANRDAIMAARIPTEGSPKNAYYRRGMSGGGWGYWVQALHAADVSCDAMSYWSGSAPTPSTAINAGIADYIRNNCPVGLQ